MLRNSSSSLASAAYVRASRRLLSNAKPALFDKILIANRGEIACRVIRTARKLGIQTVAVYSDADRNAEHVLLADEAVYLGPAPATESYLRSDKIVEACVRTGAKAVHPGYGFLSENLDFCQQCTDNGIVFIGPPPNAIRAMGSKSESKEIMIAANVPVTPGYHGKDNSNETLLAKAKEVGFPLMIKAVAGGGGKGMRLVNEESKFIESLESCRGEALRSFKDDQVLIERLIRKPRHVEFQVFGDQHGNAVHLFERDCSIQRRHQKVLEEAPAPNLTPEMRKAMGDAAVACVKATGYVGAGTVEFLIDSISEEFFFCEMNTRLQVEHPVTEAITDLDLVEWQLRVASGEKLPLTQEEIAARTRGCAVEARIYAENPLKNFLPTSGHLAHLRTPVEMAANIASIGGGLEDGVRVDSGVVKGNTVSTFYDPMIAKLIAYGDNRDEALAKLERALRQYQVAGVSNNIDFLIKCVRHPGFAREQPTTAFFEEHMDGILESLKPEPVTDLGDHTVLGVLAYLESQRLGGSAVNSSTNAKSQIWQGKGEFSNWRAARKTVRPLSIFQAGNDAIDVSVSLDNSDSAVISNADHTRNSKVLATKVVSDVLTPDRNMRCKVLDVSIQVEERLVSGTAAIQIAQDGVVGIDVWINGQTGDKATHNHFFVQTNAATDIDSVGGANPVVTSPMPGKIVKVLVADGATVKKGEAIAVLEAMKMEHIVYAPCDGTVSVYCSEGAPVQDGSKLAEVLASEQ